MAQGPFIGVDFSVKSGKVYSIRLFLKNDELDEAGTSWNIKGNHDGVDEKIKVAINEWMSDYIEGRPPKVSLPLMNYNSSTPFSSKVYAAMASIPFGRSMTYGELAAKCSSPNAARAVGTICGKNMYPLYIPCHRVLAANKKLGGFSGGVELKRRLLKHEGIKWN